MSMYNRKMVNFIIYCALALLGLYMSVFQRSLEAINDYYQLVGVYSGLLITSHFFGIFAVPLVAGELGDRYGRKVIACLSFFIMFLGMIITIFAGSIFLYTIGIFLIGGGFGVIEGMMTTIVVDLNRKRESRVINISQAFFCIGALLGPLLTSYTISLGYGWRSIYAVFAAVLVFYILYIWKLPLPSDVIPEKIEGSAAVKLLKRPVLLLLAVSIFMYVGVEQGVAFWITGYVKNLGESSLYFPSIILSLFWGLMIVGRLWFGYLSEKLNLFKLIISLTAISLVSLLLVIISQGEAMMVFSFSLFGLGMSAIWPLIMALSNRFYSYYRATAFGLMMAFSALGGMVVPFLAGVIRGLYNIKTGMAFFAIPLLIVVGAQLWIMSYSRNHSENISSSRSANSSGGSSR